MHSGFLLCLAVLQPGVTLTHNMYEGWNFNSGNYTFNTHTHSHIYRVIQEESEILWEMIVCVILSKKVHMNMGPILNGYRDVVKRRYGKSCEHEQQLRNK